MGPVLSHNLGVRNFFAAVAGDIFVSDDLESVSSLDTLLFGDFISLTNALAQASQFILIRLVPSLLVSGLASYLATFQGFPCDCVHNGHSPFLDERLGETSMGCLPGA